MTRNEKVLKAIQEFDKRVFTKQEAIQRLVDMGVFTKQEAIQRSTDMGIYIEQDQLTPQYGGEQKRQYSSGYYSACDDIVNYINCLDTQSMTASEVRKSIYHYTMQLKPNK